MGGYTVILPIASSEKLQGKSGESPSGEMQKMQRRRGRCPAKPLPMSKLWKDPVAAVTALGLAVKPFDPGGDAES
uniref:Uncharacterized protein n=1 Tax=Caenorhabditis japonica TaxID=281687 RepID=A0A8R1EE52_CAEJA